MLLQWGQHPASLVDRLGELLAKGGLLDVKLAADGGVVRAHRVVLAAASRYFEDLLSDCSDQLPVIFFRDVSLTDLQLIVQYIYTGDCQVAAQSLQSFLALANSLGVSGFTEQGDMKTTPSKRKLGGQEKENLSPLAFLTPNKKSASEPASLEDTTNTGSANKKRRLVTQSLDPLPPSPSTHRLHPSPSPSPSPLPLPSHSYALSCPTSQPLYANLSSPLPPHSSLTHHYPPFYKEPVYGNLPPSSPTQPLYANLPKPKSKVSLFPSPEPVFKVPLPPGPSSSSPRHAPTSSCPAPPSPALHSPRSTSTAPHHAPNFSFDSHFLDPDELAAKGATLLHHLAVWMIQQKKEEGGGGPALVGDELPPPSSPRVERSTTVSSSLPPQGRVVGQGLRNARESVRSESDRPDSGFDSKDGEEEEGGREDMAREEGSPEVGEMSRQAVARQPVKKKKMFSLSTSN